MATDLEHARSRLHLRQVTRGGAVLLDADGGDDAWPVSSVTSALEGPLWMASIPPLNIAPPSLGQQLRQRDQLPLQARERA